MKARRRAKRGTPSAQLLETIRSRAAKPRVCVECETKWINGPTTNPTKLCCSPTHRMRLYRKGVDLVDFEPTRTEVELLERKFEKELAEHKAKLKAGVI